MFGINCDQIQMLRSSLHRLQSTRPPPQPLYFDYEGGDVTIPLSVAVDDDQSYLSNLSIGLKAKIRNKETAKPTFIKHCSIPHTRKVRIEEEISRDGQQGARGTLNGQHRLPHC